MRVVFVASLIFSLQLLSHLADDDGISMERPPKIEPEKPYDWFKNGKWQLESHIDHDTHWKWQKEIIYGTGTALVQVGQEGGPVQDPSAPDSGDPVLLDR